MDAVDALIAEYQALPEITADPELRLVQRAMVIEDALRITLTDAEIAADLMNDPQRLRDRMITRAGS